MLVDPVHFIKASIFINCAHDAFEEIAKHLWSFKWFQLPLVHWEILGSEGVLQIVPYIFL